jgi:hypothetical protein
MWPLSYLSGAVTRKVVWWQQKYRVMEACPGPLWAAQAVDSLGAFFTQGGEGEMGVVQDRNPSPFPLDPSLTDD